MWSNREKEMKEEVEAEKRHEDEMKGGEGGGGRRRRGKGEHILTFISKRRGCIGSGL